MGLLCFDHDGFMSLLLRYLFFFFFKIADVKKEKSKYFNHTLQGRNIVLAIVEWEYLPRNALLAPNWVE